MTAEVNFHIVAFERAQNFVDRPRLVIGLCAAVAVALIAAIPGLLTSDDSGRSVRTQAFVPEAPTTTVLPEVGVVSPIAAPPSPTTTAAPAVLGTTFTRPTTTRPPSRPAPRSAAAAKPTTTTAPPKASPPTSTCRNSYDPACGPFSWNPAPGPNQPITGTISESQASPGAEVIFTLNGDDPDAAPLQVCDIDFGDRSGQHCDPRPTVDPSYCPTQYGPWTPPAKADGKLTDARTPHTYAQPGTYHVVFELRSAMNDCNNPYASTAKLEADVVVN